MYIYMYVYMYTYVHKYIYVYTSLSLTHPPSFSRCGAGAVRARRHPFISFSLSLSRSICPPRSLSLSLSHIHTHIQTHTHTHTHTHVRSIYLSPSRFLCLYSPVSSLSHALTHNPFLSRCGVGTLCERRHPFRHAPRVVLGQGLAGRPEAPSISKHTPLLPCPTLAPYTFPYPLNPYPLEANAHIGGASLTWRGVK